MVVLFFFNCYFQQAFLGINLQTTDFWCIRNELLCHFRMLHGIQDSLYKCVGFFTSHHDPTSQMGRKMCLNCHSHIPRIKHKEKSLPFLRVLLALQYARAWISFHCFQRRYLTLVQSCLGSRFRCMEVFTVVWPFFFFFFVEDFFIDIDVQEFGQLNAFCCL